MTNEAQPTLDAIYQVIQKPFWYHWEFWIFLIIGVFGLYYSIRAFKEAKKAKHAATKAGQTVKIQTITIELTEVSQELETLPPNIKFNDARRLLARVSRRLIRAVSPYRKDTSLSEVIKELDDALLGTSKALNSVSPSDPTKESEETWAVYNATQDHFFILNNTVAKLLGLFENININLGANDATTSNE